MAYNLLLTDQSDVPVSLADFTTIERGADSAAVLHLKLKNIGSSPANNVVIGILQQDPGDGTKFDSAGLPVVDEEWGQLQITGLDSSGTAGQTIGSSAWQRIGTYFLAKFPPILAGNAILFDLKMSMPTSSSEIGSQMLQIAFRATTATAIPPGFSDAVSGVISGIGSDRSFPISGLAVTATGTPDAQVHSAVGSWQNSGVVYSDGSVENTTLNQNDGASAALTTGKAYIAILSRGPGGLNVTKGLLGTSPAYPAMPTGDVAIAAVQVNYHASASVILSTDITDLRVFGRYLAVLTGGLGVTIYPGESITCDYWQHPNTPFPLVATDSSVNYIFIDKQGNFIIQTSATPPSPGALPLWHGTAAAGTLGALTDDRNMIVPFGRPFGPSGAGHSSGWCSDPGPTPGNTHFQCEDGSWAVPAGAAAVYFAEIASVVTSGSQATVHFASIPGTFKHLKLVWQARDTGAGGSQAIHAKINTDATSGDYDTGEYTLAITSSPTSGIVSASAAGIFIGNISTSASPAGSAGAGETTFPDYQGTTFWKRAFSVGGYVDSSGNEDILSTTGSWKSTAAITDILISTSGTAFVDGSIFTLYGMN